AARAEAFEDTIGGAEDSPVDADVLTQQHHLVVARHLVDDRLADCREHGHARHDTTPVSSSGASWAPEASSGASSGALRATISARCAAVRASPAAVTWSSAAAGTTSRARARSMMPSSRASTVA